MGHPKVSGNPAEPQGIAARRRRFNVLESRFYSCCTGLLVDV